MKVFAKFLLPAVLLLVSAYLFFVATQGTGTLYYFLYFLSALFLGMFIASVQRALKEKE